MHELAYLQAGDVEFGCVVNYDGGDDRDVRRADTNDASASADA